MRIRGVRLALGVAALGPLLASCSIYTHGQLAEADFLKRATREEREGCAVQVAVPDPEEAKALFGVDLARQGIQPVWVEIFNRTAQPLWLLPRSLDPEYFSPHEAAWRCSFSFAAEANAQLASFFAEQGIEIEVAPGERQAGFVFTRLDLGAKHVEIELLGQGRVERFSFVVPVPGLKADFERVDFGALYPPESIRDLTLEELREELARMPETTRNASGRDEGDPLNIAIVGDGETVLGVFVRQGWDQTETITADTSLRTASSFLFGSNYRWSPVSALYLWGRAQDIALQKARETVHERNHLRLWLAPWTCGERRVWCGQISRDIGIRFTLKRWNLTTHAIDPDIDEARDYLAQDLLASESVERIGWFRAFERVAPDAPRHNLDGGPWYSDGERLVAFLVRGPVPLREMDVLDEHVADGTVVAPGADGP